MNHALDILLRVGRAIVVIYTVKLVMYLIRRIPNPKPHIVLSIRR